MTRRAFYGRDRPMSSAFARGTFDPRLELARFQELWRGGYYEGNPLDPAAVSKYEDLGYLSILYVTHRMCIRPFIDAQTRVLEIGPGRGAWTKTRSEERRVGKE